MDDIDEFDSDNDDENAIQVSQQQQQPMPTTVSALTGGGLPQSNSQTNAASGNIVASKNGINTKRPPTEPEPALRPLKPVTKIVNPYKTKSRKPASSASSSVNNQASRKAGATPSSQGTSTHVMPERRPSFHNPYATIKDKVGSNAVVYKQPKSEPAEKVPSPPTLPDDDSPTSSRTVGNRVLMDV